MSDVAARLGLGTVQFGLPYGVSNVSGQVSPAEARAILATAQEAGIRVLDTAAAYGTAEALLGELRTQAAQFRICTKTLSLREGLTSVIARARRSAELLGGAPIDALLVHSASDLFREDGAALWSELQKLKAEGLFSRIGISAYAHDNPVELARRYQPDLMQIPLNLLDQRLFNDGSLEKLRRLGIEVHVRSIFLQGLLFVAPEMLPQKLVHAATRLAQIRTAIHAASTTPLAAALAFVLQQSNIDVAVVGVTSANQLREIISAAAAPAPGLDWGALAVDDPIVLNPAIW